MGLEAVVDVLASMAIAADPKELKWIAAEGRLSTFQNANASERTATLADLMQSVLVPLRDKLKADHGIDDAGIAKLLSDPATVNWDKHAEANTLPGSDPARPCAIDHGLRLYFREGQAAPLFDAASGWTTFGAYRAAAAAGASWSAAATATDASKQLVNLGALKGALCRITVAARAAKAAGTSLAEAFALYRTEGNLVMPLDHKHITKPWPPFERGFDFSYTPQSYHFGLKTTMQNALWGQTKNNIIRVWGRGHGDLNDWVPVAAFFDWHLIMGGFDYLVKRFLAQGFNSLTYIKFLMDIRIANGLPMADRAETRTKLADEVNAFNLTKWESDGLFLVAPEDLGTALDLATFILTQGLLFMKASGKPEVDGPFIAPNKTLQYLAYNTSHRRSIDLDKNRKDLFSSVLASAAVALTQKAIGDVPNYCSDAYTKLSHAGLPSKLPSVSESEEHAATAKKVKTALTDPAAMEQFAQFILRVGAGRDEWRAYLANRGNLARYTRLLSFYTTLTADMGI